MRGIDAIKAAVVDQLKAMAARRLREQAQPTTGTRLYAFRGFGSTFHRLTKIEEIYARWVPVPDARGDKITFAFLDEVKKIILTAITEIKQKVEQTRLQTK